MSTNIKAIVFDFGGVLIEWNPRNLYRRYFLNQPQAMEDFLMEIDFMGWNAQQDRGRSFADGVEILSRQFPQHAHLIRAYHEHWQDSIGDSIEGTVNLLIALKEKGFPIFGLSNWSAETFPIVRDKFDFLHLLDGVILSGEVKLVKPERAIFELCLKMTGRPADECLFVDDSEINIRAAKEIGFDIILFRSPEQLKAELQARHLL